MERKNTMTVNELNRIQDRVEHLLTVKEITRDNDKLMYLEYLKMFYPEFSDKSYEYVMMYAPSYESITRVRRKVQELFPELQGRNHRTKSIQEEVYREYAAG